MTEQIIRTWYLNVNNIEPWAFIDGLFSKEECEKIKEIGDRLPTSTGTVELEGHKYGEETKKRKGKVAWLNSNDKESEFIFRRCTDAVQHINDKFWQFNLDYIENLQYTIYEELGDHYQEHMDLAFNTVHYRKLSFSVQLDISEDYEGCDLEIYYGGEKIPTRRNQGSIIIFPSYALHTVTELKSGTRKSLVGWVCGPKFK